MSDKKGTILYYEGCNYLRQRLVLATLSGKSVEIKNIRHKDDDPGLREFEASFIRMLDKITNGSRIEVNETGTKLFYQPGLLIGGRFDHDCSLQKSVVYYLESLVCLGPFCKKPLEATLRGVTNSHEDLSVDAFKTGTIPVLRKCIGPADEGLDFKIVRRGLGPKGGGQVIFTCPIRRYLRPLHFTDQGKVKRVRGVAFGTRVSPSTPNRIVEAAKGVLLKFLPDIYIYTDHCKGPQAGMSPGFGLSLVAETTTGAFLTSDVCSNPAGSPDGVSVPEDLGVLGAHLLLEEIYRGGCVDSTNQSLACLFMTLGQQDVSKLLLGPLSPYTIQFLRHIKDFFQIMFKLEAKQQEDDEELSLGADKVLLTCLGIGFTNLSKITT